MLPSVRLANLAAAHHWSPSHAHTTTASTAHLLQSPSPPLHEATATNRLRPVARAAAAAVGAAAAAFAAAPGPIPPVASKLIATPSPFRAGSHLRRNDMTTTSSGVAGMTGGGAVTSSRHGSATAAGRGRGGGSIEQSLLAPFLHAQPPAATMRLLSALPPSDSSMAPREPAIAHRTASSTSTPSLMNKGSQTSAGGRRASPPVTTTPTPIRDLSNSPAPYSAVAAKLDRPSPPMTAPSAAPSLQSHQPIPAAATPLPTTAPTPSTAAHALLGVPPPTLPGRNSPSLESVREFPPLSAAATCVAGPGSRRPSSRSSPLLGAVSSSSASSSPSMPPLESIAATGVRSSSPGGIRAHSRTLPLHKFHALPDLDHLTLPSPSVPTRGEDKGSAAQHAAMVSMADVAAADTFLSAEEDSEFESARLFDRRGHLTMDGDHFCAPPSDPSDVDMSRPQYLTAKQELLAAHAPVAIRILSDGLSRATSPIRFAASPLTLPLVRANESGHPTNHSPSFDFFSEHVCAEASSASHSMSFSASLQCRDDLDDWQSVAWDSPSVATAYAGTGPRSSSFSPIRAPSAFGSRCDGGGGSSGQGWLVDADGDARRALHSHQARSCMHALIHSSNLFAQPNAAQSLAGDTASDPTDEFVLLEPQS